MNFRKYINTSVIYSFILSIIFFYYIIHFLSFLSDFSLTPVLNKWVILFIIFHLISFFYVLVYCLKNFERKKEILLNFLLFILLYFDLKINTYIIFEKIDFKSDIQDILFFGQNNYILAKLYFYILIFFTINFELKKLVNIKKVLEAVIIISFALIMTDIFQKIYLNLTMPHNFAFFNLNILRITLPYSNATLQDSFIIFISTSIYLVFFYENKIKSNIILIFSGLSILFLFSKLFIVLFFLFYAVFIIYNFKYKKLLHIIKYYLSCFFIFYIFLFSFQQINLYLNNKYNQNRCFNPNILIYLKFNFIFDKIFESSKIDTIIISQNCNQYLQDPKQLKNLKFHTGLEFKNKAQAVKYVYDSSYERYWIYKNNLNRFIHDRVLSQKFWGINYTETFYDKRFLKKNKINYESMFLDFLLNHGVLGFLLISFFFLRMLILGSANLKILSFFFVILSFFHNSHFNFFFLLVLFILNFNDVLKYRLKDRSL